MKLLFALLIGLFCLIISCKEAPDFEDPSTPTTPLMECYEPNDTLIINNRTFNMGFSTWTYAQSPEARTNTYEFIGENGDIYSEQFDNHIPWFGLFDGRPLPEDAGRDINTRVENQIADNELVVSVSLFNPERNDLITAYNNQTPMYGSLSDQQIEDAYFNFLTAVLKDFSNVKYLVIAMEVNEFYLKQPDKWEGYKTLMSNLKPRVYELYPDLLISESISLHSLVDSEDAEYVNEIFSYVNTMDFVAVSYYPFMHGVFSDMDIQADFDFLHENITAPIAFVETTQIAEDLELQEFTLTADECTQKDYAQLLLSNAQEHDYQFVIWWAHKDYDELYDALPDDTKPLARLWRDTGLINGSDQERPAYREWKTILNR
ncbi:hypothetical protein [Marinoscillum sp.]|uniref:hypothetical protein n=1 Tax=Marinoscillum sp. TaxID=2024838 RepID=UPI003BA86EC5